ncbi:MAG TPA: hypothetical protein VJR47_08950 [Stellaceae bacterium]|nr:hypothetical protein [Stellaceae bacterium]
MRLRLLKLCCLFLVLALAGGLIVFDFAGDDLQSAFIETSAVTPAAMPDHSASANLPPADIASTSAPAATGAPAADTASPDAAPPSALAPSDTQAPAAASTQAQAADTSAQAEVAATSAAPSASPPSDQGADEQAPPAAPAQTQPAQSPEQTQVSDQGAPASVASVEGHAVPPPSPAPAEAAPAPVAAVEPPPAPAAAKSGFSVSASASGKYAVRAAIPAPVKEQQRGAPPPEAVAKPQPAPPASPPASAAHHAASGSAAPAAAPAQAAEDDVADYQIASNASSPGAPSPKLVAQTAPPSAAPLVSSEMHDPRSAAPLAGSQVALGPQTLIEFPSLQSTASGSLAGTGSVTNSSTRVIPGIIGSWTSAPLDALPLGPSFGTSLFIGAPATGDSVATASTSGGYTLKLGQTNNWPVIMPRFFMGLPVTDGTSASLGTGVWINNIKETATLANATSTQSDEHSGMMVRPFLNAAIMQRAPLFEFLPPDAQKLKLSGGYIFGDSSFQAAFCAAGQTCVKTSDQGSWFLGLSYEFGFPVGGAAPR